MPVYNSSPYLREAIDSVLSQTFTDFELILLNDGSTDDSEEIINTYNDARIVYVSNKKNLGLIATLNIGLKMAKGSYIARMDADDVCMPNRFAEQIAMFSLHPEAIAVGSDYFKLIGNKLKLVTNVNNSDYSKSLLMFSTCFCHPTVMLKNKHELFYEAEFLHAEDYRLWTQLAKHGKFLNVNKPLLKYRYHSQQVSSKFKNIQLSTSAEIRKQYVHQLGFKISGDDLATHNLIGDNTRITSISQLNSISQLLLSYVSQNAALKSLNDADFKFAMHKFWLDSCGNTSLGLIAYQMYFKSELSKYVYLTSKQKIILLAKCLWRWLK